MSGEIDFKQLDDEIDRAYAAFSALNNASSEPMDARTRTLYNKLAVKLLNYFEQTQRAKLESRLGKKDSDNYNFEFCSLIKSCLRDYDENHETKSGEATSFSRYFSVRLKLSVQRFIAKSLKKREIESESYDDEIYSPEKSEAQNEKTEQIEKALFTTKRLLKCADVVFSREQERVRSYRGAILTFCLLKELSALLYFSDKNALYSLLSPHSFFDGDVFSSFFSSCEKLTLEKVGARFGKIRNDASRTKRVILTRVQEEFSLLEK